ncbi:hypothetical protein PFAG_02926 [Plasmodium falciparum Santa Lucia]|uniref:Uncharacterized protein n=9 Tax=Plasmodium falciparum TaxID=5833 RepID=A0A024W6V2_PLAFA|nr:hypothetical protein PFFVO_02937 [Plasmodium falciparum Vietnam Oak-Knoll (FVO)]ETW28576.1 hypothetical protein PFFCH_03947 [Plasmodium falciparum FCH/4]ETW36303.1 hypothetical protein PFTANZ_03007 [Plasmodium falciparum Tanzania (2000708)]ETW61057.1 hypothetical protein PFMC_02925 [Plasmodium falciparum CAMP/Malaysia]EUR71287.1 hypothetical protein PFBG_03014 [Plasmodium falciparum 7G8]EUT85565.1 hypothetical protein PFAG_02926 [Plasmodium falciparum Santa Lucia]EWC76282.1 hypothetical pr
MKTLYHEDIIIFLSIESLEEILSVFKNIGGIKGRFHKFISFKNKSNISFFFNSSDYLFLKKEPGKIIDEKYKLLTNNKADDKNIHENNTSEDKNIFEKQTNIDIEPRESFEKGEEKILEAISLENKQNNAKDINDCRPHISKNKNVENEEYNNNLKKVENKNVENEEDNNNLKKTENKNVDKISNLKYTNDEYEMIIEEVYKHLYKNETYTPMSEKKKMVVELIIETIIYGNKIKLNIYKLNLFISIVIMTLYQIMENLGVKEKKKKKTINYFITLLKKNIQYNNSPEQNKKIKDTQNNTSSEVNINTQNEKHITIQNQEKDNNNNVKNNNTIIKNDNKDIIKIKKTTIKNDKRKQSSNTSMNLIDTKEENILINSTNEVKINEEKETKNDIIFFNYEEAKYIIKYMFENIFSIYNILEYMFLFPSYPVHLCFTNYCSFVSPPDPLSLKDEIKEDEQRNEDNTFSTNAYISQVLHIPLYVLDKFYNNLNDLQEKIDNALTLM